MQACSAVDSLSTEIDYPLLQPADSSLFYKAIANVIEGTRSSAADPSFNRLVDEVQDLLQFLKFMDSMDEVESFVDMRWFSQT